MRTYLSFDCKYCNQTFQREIRQTYGGQVSFCSKLCKSNFSNKRIAKNCPECSKELLVKQSELRKSKTGRSFCSRTCSVTWNNKNKTKGIRVSKLELWLQAQLNQSYPNLEFHFNQKDTVNSELDIYIPSLKLAFELNGIFHYEPIYGNEKLEQIQNNDKRKLQACVENGIELCIIDSSSFKHFKESLAMKYLHLISEKISQTC